MINIKKRIIISVISAIIITLLCHFLIPDYIQNFIFHFPILIFLLFLKHIPSQFITLYNYLFVKLIYGLFLSVIVTLYYKNFKVIFPLIIIHIVTLVYFIWLHIN